MDLALRDPLKNVLRQYASDIALGGPVRGRLGVPQIDPQALISDLGRAKSRNTVRFAIVFGFLGVGLLASIGLAIWPPPGVKPPYLVAGSGLYSVSTGALLLEIARSWWRTDTLLTVAKFASPASLELIIQKLLEAELKPSRKRRDG
jgi:hypothetical protein